MIALRGVAASTSLRQPLRRRVWKLVDPDARPDSDESSAVLVNGRRSTPDGFGLCVTKHGARAGTNGHDQIELPPELDHLSAGDVLGVSTDGTRLRVLWRHQSQQNSILLTERCDNYCLMCSQPPKHREDDWLLEDAFELIGLLPAETQGLCFTGGEPTLFGEEFIKLMKVATGALPDAAIHVLSNGRRFADRQFTADYATIDNPNLMVGIPIYGVESELHDYVVQAVGAFDQTVRGIMRLAELEQSIEIRVVLQKHTAPVIVDIAEFISRNLPFVDQVALMGLEMIGLARTNFDEVWIDPWEYREPLAEAAWLLHRAGIRTMIYNHQLCLLDRRVWPFAVKSISDWKNEYDPICATCRVLDRCGGFFHSAQHQASSHIHPLGDGDLVGPQRLVAVGSSSGHQSLGAEPVPVQWRAGIGRRGKN